MSFTVMRYRDGKETPIKMSIWDAFKGAPNPRLRSQSDKPCSCCNKIHPKKQIKKTPEHTAQPDTKANINDNATTNSRSTKDIETFSKEDDAKIIEMKAAQKSWKEILAAINKKSQSQIKDHWKTIDPSRNTSNSNKEPDGKKKADIKRQKAEGQAKKQKETQKQGLSGAGTRNDSTSHAGAIDTRGLESFADRYDRNKWMAAASKHFDLTGERITAATARRLAEQGTR